MKKIISLIAIALTVALIFIFAACGNNMTDDIKDEMTTLKDDAGDIMDDMSEAMSDIDSELTENGNVTEEDTSDGLFEDMMTDAQEDAADKTDEAETTTGAAE